MMRNMMMTKIWKETSLKDGKTALDDGEKRDRSMIRNETE